MIKLMQKMLKVQEESDGRLVELEESSLRRVTARERVAAKKRKEGIPAVTAAINDCSCCCTHTCSCC